MYLVDTNVIPAAAPTKSKPHTAVVAWMDAQSRHLYLSSVTIAEISDGISRAEREGATRKSANLTAWLDTLLHLYADRVLPFDTPVSLLAGRLADRARGLGHAPGFADIAIAATAEHHRLMILTRNARHFAPLGVALCDPFMGLPPTPRTFAEPGPSRRCRDRASRAI